MTDIEKLFRRAAKRAVRTEESNPAPGVLQFRYCVKLDGVTWALTDSEREMKKHRRELIKQAEARLNAAVSTLQKAGLKVYIKDNI